MRFKVNSRLSDHYCKTKRTFSLKIEKKFASAFQRSKNQMEILTSDKQNVCNETQLFERS